MNPLTILRITFFVLCSFVAVFAQDSKAVAPYPPSPVIQRLEWAAKETILRQAKGSDNWPMTWADDDVLYTAYGDGIGFEPFIPEKLSMGFAKITGTPPNFKGENLRAPSAETHGGGAAGKKASGMLMVDGVLYLWARIAANAQLAWSHDHGATWTWADWRFTESFGCPTFLNFGKNYAGARDEFVYVYSHDSNSAYERADRVVLARIHKTKLRARAAYEFFAGFDASGQPRWTREMAQREAVFTHHGYCYRLGVTYNAALRRYLLVQPLANRASRDNTGKLDVRFSGGLAVYDAPEPWGPWTTVFFTDQWDVGPGDTASFPTKWMSADGKTLHLVFSGDDFFSVRQATLTTTATKVDVTPDFTELEKVITAELQATNTPGAAIGIVRGDQLIYAKGFGVSNVETGAPVTPDMLFRLGSTTKMFTAAALVQLAEQGKLKFDEPIGKYAKGLSPKIASLTAHQLLSHTSGLKDNATMFGKHDDEALGETVRALKDDFFFAEPGRVYSYSNPGYWLAGYLLEAVSGKAYAEQMKESLFQPLGMQRTTLRPTMAMTYPLAQGHESVPPKVVRPAADNAGNWPAGSMFSSVNDLSRWVIAFMNGGKLEGKQVLSPSLIATLSAPRADVPGASNKYGYGLMVGTLRDVQVVEHGGSRSGYGSLIRMAPEQRVAIIILVNRTGGSLNKTAEKAGELMLPLAMKLLKEKHEPFPMTEAEMYNYVGVYGDAPNTVELLVKAGKLFRKVAGNEVQVVKIGDSRLTAGTAEFALILSADGKAEFLHAGGRTLKKQQ